MAAAETTNECVLPTDQGLQLWRLFETPLYRKLRSAQEFMERSEAPQNILYVIQIELFIQIVLRLIWCLKRYRITEKIPNRKITLRDDQYSRNT